MANKYRSSQIRPKKCQVKYVSSQIRPEKCQVKYVKYVKSNIFDLTPIFDLKNALSNNLPTPTGDDDFSEFFTNAFMDFMAFKMNFSLENYVYLDLSARTIFN